ncbi:17-beta-hydroxysteroid dehydrogenase type 6-like [Elgaria multicarinata webbii]|uniref:17-beta-hydroxysteroid dehydrogenase type 6-like n=1 Tax=Elgaria multicarinata webbii TaxID=159646 RepID=UPI002FCD5BD5
MWLYLAALLGLYFLYQWYRERQTVENLREKYVFITGCDSGFGNKLARQLDARGLRVLAACLTQKGAEQLKKATSERLKTTILDVTSTENVEAATKWTKSCIGNKGLWGLVNNAGICVPSGPNEWMTKDDFAKVINVNLLGLIDVTLHLLPLVRKARGRVVNISSVMGRVVFCGGGYCPSKFGVEAFSDSLRRELLPFEVKLSIVEPGAFITPILLNVEEYFSIQWHQTTSDIRESYGQQYFEKLCKLYQSTLMTANTNLSLVTDHIEHALLSRYPRTRYSPGWDAKLFFIPFSYLPASVQDFLMSFFWPKPAQPM